MISWWFDDAKINQTCGWLFNGMTNWWFHDDLPVYIRMKAEEFPNRLMVSENHEVFSRVSSKNWELFQILECLEFGV